MSGSEATGSACFLCWNRHSSVGVSRKQRNVAKLLINCWAKFLPSSPQMTVTNENFQACDQLDICGNCFENCTLFYELYKEWNELERQLIGRLTSILEHVKNFASRNMAPSHHGSLSSFRRELLQKSREKLDSYPNAAFITPAADIKLEENSSNLGELQAAENYDCFPKVTTSEKPEVDDGNQLQKLPYSCTASNCKMKFQTASQLNVHLTHHGKFPCNFCLSTFTYAPELSLHEQKHSDKSVMKVTKTGKTIRYQYARCPFDAFRDRFYVSHHLKKHLNLEIASLHCPVCQVKVRDNLSLKEHQKFHQIEGLATSQIFTCSQCSAQFNSTGALLVHHRQVHWKSSNTCRTCAETFTNSYNLRLHLKTAHMKTTSPDLDFPLVCATPYCGRRFDLETRLQRHQQNCRQPHDKILCPDCGKAFKKKSYMDCHVMMKHCEPKHICDECGEGFAFPCYLESHKNSRHSEAPDVPCPDCGKQFPSERGLNKHVKNVHKLRDQLCSECGKSFKTRTGLKKHVGRMHDKKNNHFNCIDCGKICVSKVQLDIHKRSHSKAKSLSCSHCEKRFKQKRGLDEHMKQKHTGMDFSTSH